MTIKTVKNANNAKKRGKSVKFLNFFPLFFTGANTLGSSAEMELGGILITGSATLLGTLIGGSAGAKVGFTAGRWISRAWTMYESGKQQAGSDFYQLYKLQDSQGNTLDLQNPNTRAIFFIDAALMGSIEVLGMDWTPGYKQIMNLIAPETMRRAIGKTLLDRLKVLGVDFIQGLAGEALEEFSQGIVSDALTNAILESSNTEDGTDFEVKEWREIIADASQAFAQAAYGMVLQSALSSAIGFGIDSNRLSLASKNQNIDYKKGDKLGVIDRKYINQKVETQETTETETSETEKGNSKENKKKNTKEKTTEESEEKIGTINVIQTQRGATPATATDAENLKKLDKKVGKKSYQVAFKQVQVDELPSQTRQSVLNPIGLYLQNENVSTSIEYTDDGRLVFENSDALAKAKEALSDVGFDFDAEGNELITPQDDKGQSYRIGFSLKEDVQKEGIAVKKSNAWEFLNMKRQAGFMVSAQDFLNESEAQYAFKKLVQKVTGNEQSVIDAWFDDDQDAISMELPDGVTWENLAGAANFMPILSKITGRDTDDLLSDESGSIRIVVDEGSQTAEDVRTGEQKTVAGGFRKESADGKTYYTVHLTKNATAETVTHELMHIARALASKEKLEGFKKAYGMQDLWTDDIKDNDDGTYSFNGKVYTDRNEAFKIAAQNEERFVEDFFRYLSTGQAPNQEIATFFEKLKQFIRDVIQKFGEALSQDTVDAFDKLLGGQVDTTLAQDLDTAVELSEQTLYDDTEKVSYSPVIDAIEDDEDNGIDEYGNPLYHVENKLQNYQETKKNILKYYSNPKLYTNADTSSGNVYVYSDYYNAYLNKGLSNKQEEVFEKELKAAEVFGNAGFQTYILPEKLVIAEKKYNGKIADAIMNGFLVEFKKLESKTYEAFQRNLSDGLKKADIVYVELQDSLLITKKGKTGPKNAIAGEFVHGTIKM